MNDTQDHACDDASVAAAAKVTADLEFVSDRLSTQTRQIAIGVIAILWALTIGDLKGVAPLRPSVFLALATAVICTMLLDFLQYLAGYRTSMKALADIEHGGRGLYDKRWFSYRLRNFLFYAKVVVALLLGAGAICTFGTAMLNALRSEQPNAVKQTLSLVSFSHQSRDVPRP